VTQTKWPPAKPERFRGLLFIAFQRDPRAGFVKIFERISKLDAMNQFTTHTGSGLFACPAGVRKGEFIGQSLFEPGA
jgi:deferrochelatase/peroxidase EfeB